MYDDMDDRAERRERALRRIRARREDSERPVRRRDAEEDRFSMDRLYRTADEFAARPTPRLDVDEWEYERRVRSPPRSRPPSEPEEKPPLISETALRVVVGDLAPQAAGVLNVLQNNTTARSAATMAGMGLVALVLPQMLK